jgi:hypothetical protein
MIYDECIFSYTDPHEYVNFPYTSMLLLVNKAEDNEVRNLALYLQWNEASVTSKGVLLIAC